MRLLDLFCGAGGASVGYARAGFDVTGVDAAPQPDYPFEFHQGDALQYLAEHAAEFDAVHASPPCMEHSTLTCNRADRTGTAGLLDETLAALARLDHGIWVAENVMGARMPTDMVLCGSMFGLRTYRHRRFRIGPGVPWLAVPPHPRHTVPAPHRQRQQAWDDGWNMDATGHDAERPNGRHYAKFGVALGIDWMRHGGLNLAIPPAYTEFIGGLLIEALAMRSERCS